LDFTLEPPPLMVAFGIPDVGLLKSTIWPVWVKVIADPSPEASVPPSLVLGLLLQAAAVVARAMKANRNVRMVCT
jgi:hypothetical protein